MKNNEKKSYQPKGLGVIMFVKKEKSNYKINKVSTCAKVTPHAKVSLCAYLTPTH